MSKHAKIESDDDLTTEILQPLPSTLITPEVAIPLDLPMADVATVIGGGDAGACDGSFRLNHKEPTEADMDAEPAPAQPADLPVTDDVAIVGGGDGGSYGGSIRLNHNEPVVADTDEI